MLSSGKKKYLFTICELGLNGEEIQSTKIAHQLGVKRPSVAKMLSALMEDGYIEKEYYGKVSLTEAGLLTANQLYANYLLLYAYFHQLLQFSSENARHDALVCICDFSEEGIERLAASLLEKQKLDELPIL